MATWKEISIDNLLAAQNLFEKGRYRSCISRAYYAAYCAATNEIVMKVTTFPYGWKNPPPQKVPDFILFNLSISQAKKENVSKLIIQLREAREDADYRPNKLVDETTALDCIRDASTIQEELWGTDK